MNITQAIGMEPYELLNYGAMGLGCILAVLTYRLLTQEQKQPHPRGKILIAVYVFMAFSLSLTVVGAISEHIRNEAEDTAQRIKKLETERDKLRDALSASRDKLANVESTVSTYRGTIQGIAVLKGGAIDQLRKVQPSDSGDRKLVDEIARELADLNKQMSNAVSAGGNESQ
jgi:hypothetical protein